MFPSSLLRKPGQNDFCQNKPLYQSHRLEANKFWNTTLKNAYSHHVVLQFKKKHFTRRIPSYFRLAMFITACLKIEKNIILNLCHLVWEGFPNLTFSYILFWWGCHAPKHLWAQKRATTTSRPMGIHESCQMFFGGFGTCVKPTWLAKTEGIWPTLDVSEILVL